MTYWYGGMSNLAKCRLTRDVLYPLCKDPLEDANHLSRNCQISSNQMANSSNYKDWLFGSEETSWFMKDKKVPSKILWDLYRVVLAQNNKGQIMGSCTYPYDGIHDAFVAEARACERALLFAAKMGFLKISVEGDSLTTRSSDR
ncbi:hypothetical protein GOBAR_DD33335 [Gossypium barbadense]|nr:hypothetical protein GOBAR_DD33335 [Gossypium barbadense]